MSTPKPVKQKTIFQHDEKLNKKHTFSPYESFNKANPTFYNVDRAALDVWMTREQRTSKYLIPDEDISDIHKIAILVKTMGSVTRYVAGRPVKLHFDQEKQESYSETGNDKINVSLRPLFDHRIPFHTRLNVVIGVTFHETMHVLDTTPGVERFLRANRLMKDKLNPRTGKRMQVPDWGKANQIFDDNKLFANLHNIVEDKRIEAKGLELFPGFVYYLEDMRNYALWLHFNQLTDPKLAVDTSNPDAYYAMLTAYIAYRSGLPEALDSFLKIAPTDKTFVKLMANVDEILKSKNETFEDSLEIAKKLFALYPKEQQDKAKGMSQTEASEPGESPNEGPKEQQAGDGDKEAKQKIQKAIADAKDEQTSQKTPIDKVVQNNKTDKSYSHYTTHPAPKGEFDNEIFKEAAEISRTISKNLSFLDSRFNRTQETFELLSGNLDEEELYGLQHNRAIFTEEEEAPGYSMDLAVLVDESGSMGWGRKIREAKVASLALALALQNNDHINLYVYGHTADNRSGEQVSLFRYLDPKERATDLNTLFTIQARSNNADGYAIARMGEVLKKGTSKQKVLIVISDGQPAAGCYGDGIGHTRDMVTMLEKSGIFVVQICVDNVEESGEMFTNFIPFNKEKLGMNLRKVLMKKLVEISNSI